VSVAGSSQAAQNNPDINSGERREGSSYEGLEELFWGWPCAATSAFAANKGVSAGTKPLTVTEAKLAPGDYKGSVDGQDRALS